MTIDMIDLYLNISSLNCADGVSDNSWSAEKNLSVIFNSTFKIPTISEIESTIGNANQYNTTIYSSTNNSAVKIENASMPNWDNKDTDTINVIVSNKTLPQCGTAAAGSSGICWEETASIAIQGLSSGQNSISISYDNFAAATPAATTTASSSGGGGGGGATVSVTKTSYSKTFSTLLPTVKRTITQGELTRLGTPLKQITILVADKATKVKITVEKLEEKPSSVPVTGSTVYQYINIDTENLEDSNIAESKIKFEVPRSWLTDNGVGEEDISLARFSICVCVLVVSKEKCSADAARSEERR